MDDLPYLLDEVLVLVPVISRKIIQLNKNLKSSLNILLLLFVNNRIIFMNSCMEYVNYIGMRILFDCRGLRVFLSISDGRISLPGSRCHLPNLTRSSSIMTSEWEGALLPFMSDLRCQCPRENLPGRNLGMSQEDAQFRNEWRRKIQGSSRPTQVHPKK